MSVTATQLARTGLLLCCTALLATFGLQAETRIFDASVVLPTSNAATLSKADEQLLTELLSKRDMNCAEKKARMVEIQAGRQELPDALESRRRAIAHWLESQGVEPHLIFQTNAAHKRSPLERGIHVLLICTPSS